MSRIATENASSVATENATTYLKNSPSVLLATTTLMQRCFFAERIKQDAERFRAEVEKLDIPVTVITEDDCIPDHYKNDINGKIIAINPAILKPEYQRADRQLYYVTGGFGASANARGSAVFCKNLYDGKNTRYERMDVLGEIKPERMPDWAKEKAAAFSRTIQGKDHER